MVAHTAISQHLRPTLLSLIISGSADRSRSALQWLPTIHAPYLSTPHDVICSITNTITTPRHMETLPTITLELVEVHIGFNCRARRNGADDAVFRMAETLSITDRLLKAQPRTSKRYS